jgi:hypothetical protein
MRANFVATLYAIRVEEVSYALFYPATTVGMSP